MHRREGHLTTAKQRIICDLNQLVGDHKPRPCRIMGFVSGTRPRSSIALLLYFVRRFVTRLGVIYFYQTLFQSFFFNLFEKKNLKQRENLINQRDRQSAI